MTPHALAVPLMTIGFLLVVAAFGWWVLHRPARPRREPGYHPQHAVTARHHHAKGSSEEKVAREFYDARDQTDPDGTLFLAAIKFAPGLEAAGPLPPDPAENYQPAPETATAIRDRELPSAGFLEPVPDDIKPGDTRPQAVVLCELGMPTQEYVDRLFADAVKAIGVLPAEDSSDEKGREAA